MSFGTTLIQSTYMHFKHHMIKSDEKIKKFLSLYFEAIYRHM